MNAGVAIEGASVSCNGNRDGLTEAGLASLDSMLVGEHVRLHQYVPGFATRSYLYGLWRAAENDGANREIFYGRLWQTEKTPFSRIGDLADFCAYFSGETKCLVVAETLDGNLVGYGWLDEMIPGIRASVNVFIRKEYRGKVGLEAGRLFFRYATEFLGFRTLWGLTPWRQSVLVGRWLGMKQVALIPAYQPIDGKLMDLYVLRYEARK